MGWKRILSHEYFDRIDPKPSKQVQRYVYPQRLCDICSWCAVHLQEDMHWLNMATYWFFLGGVVIGFIQINDTHMHRPVKTAYRQGKIKSMIEKLTENREKKSISNKRENHANNEKGFMNHVTCWGLRPATLLKRRLWYRCFPVNFAKFLRTPLLTEHPLWLFLKVLFRAKLRTKPFPKLGLQLTKNWTPSTDHFQGFCWYSELSLTIS